ncbi:MAG TPA: amidohydrolase family protein [Methylomirabilota bacterium]|jgi:N-acyl-D-aspartate/D-glutamate deacylase|nr:amidohydrolase family protein [Methylomirabilota bacterium]
MAYDLIVKGGMVVDGSGFSRYRADVAVKDGVIAEIGRIDARAEQTIDADGLVVAPGIIDLHTHYDAQPFWDRLCTSSIWHGVTTALMGNCGLTLAPLRPEHRDPMLATFCCVEDLPVRSLAAVLPWTWETFDEYLKAIDIGLGMNLMPLVGHNPLRLSAMDKAAWDRAATPDEIAVMQNLLRAAMEAGAWGWSTTDSPTHAGPKGEPVPTRLAADEERVALGRALGEFNRGIIEILPKGAGAPTDADHAHLTDVARASGRPVFFLTFDAAPRARVEASTREGAQMYALLRAIPFNPRFTLKKTTFFGNLDVWDVVMAKPVPERMAAFADPEKRAQLREWADKRQRRRPGVPGRFIKWASIVVKKTALPKNRGLEGRVLTDLAAEMGKHVADVMLDLALEEKLDTEFQLQSRPPAEDVELAEFVKTGHAIPSQSDAGAHLNTNFCTAGESSWVLGEWVRERQLMTLEDAIRRYTFQPARIMGLHDRGLVRAGMTADLMVFDPATIGVREDEVAQDGPSGTPRRVQGADGVHHVVVGGQPVMNHGKHTGAFPGRVLRANRRATA